MIFNFNGAVDRIHHVNRISRTVATDDRITLSVDRRKIRRLYQRIGIGSDEHLYFSTNDERAMFGITITIIVIAATYSNAPVITTYCGNDTAVNGNGAAFAGRSIAPCIMIVYSARTADTGTDVRSDSRDIAAVDGNGAAIGRCFFFAEKDAGHSAYTCATHFAISPQFAHLVAGRLRIDSQRVSAFNANTHYCVETGSVGKNKVNVAHYE